MRTLDCRVTGARLPLLSVRFFFQGSAAHVRPIRRATIPAKGEQVTLSPRTPMIPKPQNTFECSDMRCERTGQATAGIPAKGEQVMVTQTPERAGIEQVPVHQLYALREGRSPAMVSDEPGAGTSR